MNQPDRYLLNGDEAVAMAALDAGVALGTGYPGTPSTEILEAFSELGGNARWAPNEKVALEVGIGVAFGGARALVTMKHVGLNVAADPLFTVAYTGVAGAWSSYRRTIRACHPAKTNRTTGATRWRPACRCSNRRIRRRPTT